MRCEVEAEVWMSLARQMGALTIGGGAAYRTTAYRDQAAVHRGRRWRNLTAGGGALQVLLEVPDEQKGGGKYERVKLLDKRPALSEVPCRRACGNGPDHD
jgi:hypothetical protein